MARGFKTYSLSFFAGNKTSRFVYILSHVMKINTDILSMDSESSGDHMKIYCLTKQITLLEHVRYS
jgi:hypothetical protein